MTGTTLHNVVINYKLEGIDGVTRKIRETYSANKDLSKGTQETSKSMGGLATRFVGLQAVMSFAMQKGRELVAWVKDSIQKFREFDNAMAEVSTILKGDLYTNISLMSAGVEHLSVTWGKATSDLADGLYDILSAAVPAEDAMSLLTTSTKAAIAGLTDVATSVDVFTSIMNAWGLAASQMNRVSDQLFQTVIRGKLVFGDLANAMGYIAPIAANLGVEFEEVAAALSTVTRQGQHVDMATRGLALGLQNIADLSPKAAEAARKYGVDLSSTALRVGGLEYIIRELNDATKEYGMSILPQMISNMRSLRVFMALAGSEGIEGYMYDLEQLKNVTNETDVALAKMAGTAKMQADIAEQSMQKLQRSVGEAWHDIDIWYKKIQLWLGTWISGGNANEAVRDYEERVNALQLNMLKLYKTQLQLEAVKPFSEVAKGFKGDWAKDGIEFLKQLDVPGGGTLNLIEGVSKYLELLGESTNAAEIKSMFDELKITVDAFDKSVWDMAGTAPEALDPIISLGTGLVDLGAHIHDVAGDFAPLLGVWVATSKASKEALERSVKISPETVKETNVLIDSINEKLESLRGKGGIPADQELFPRLKKDTSLAEFKNTITDIKEEIKFWDIELENLNAELDVSGEMFTHFKEGIATLGTELSNHQDNILELKNALIELNYEVTDMYETLGKQSFDGVKRWELAVTGATASLDRFLNYTRMTIEYGDDWDNTYMKNIKTLKGYSDAVGEANRYLGYYDLEIWEATIAGKEFEGGIDKLIIQMGNVNQQYKESTRFLRELKNQTDEHTLTIRKNNLAIMEIELKGMMRRRGLTRSEEKKIQKLKIENMKERIASTKLELSEEALAHSDYVNKTKDQYDYLKEIYDEYVARVQHQLWEMKDTRASDMANLITWIGQSEDNIATYSEWLDEETATMTSTWNTYIGLLSALAAHPDTEKMFRDLTGETFIHDAMTAMTSWSQRMGILIPLLQKVPLAAIATTSMGALSPGIGFPEFEQNLAFRNRQRGSHYIADTGAYILHRGETVSPAGKDTGHGDVYINIVNNNNITTEFDMDSFASKQAAAIAQKLGNRRSGKSNFRLR